MTTSLTSPLSPYLQILEAEISADLHAVVKPEDLRDEIRKTLSIEILKRAQSALYDLQNALSYLSSDTVAVQKHEAAALRHVGYVQEILNMRRIQRIDPNYQLTSGTAD